MNTQIFSKLFTLTKQDFISGVTNAVIAAVFVGLAGLVTTPGFDVFHADWIGILHSVINWGFAGFIGSLGKSFVSDSEGKILGYKVK